jgi:predicted RNA-binding Zn-ribbon protein involved in translation (DUF1610 family)
VAEVEVTRHAPPGAARRTDDLEASHPCPSCADPEIRRYCPTCGEKQISEEDLSLRRFAGEAIHTFTNLESSVFRTFGSLVARPGHLTVEYLDGRRKRYIRPLQLFILCNVLFFILQPYIGLDLLTTPLSTHFHHFYGALARDLVESRIAARGITLEEYAQEFNRTVALQARSLVVLMVPIFALLVYAMDGSVRRYFVEHLIFSLHFYSFFLVFTILFSGALAVLFYLLISTGFGRAAILLQLHQDSLATVTFLITLGGYFTVAARRVYGRAWWLRVIKGAALSLGVFVVLLLYRFMLFFTTYLSV